MTDSALAEQEDTLSGRIDIGIITINSANNLNPNGSKDFLTDLSSSASRETSVVPIVLPTVTWDVGDNDGAKLFLDAEPPIDEAGSFVFGLGGSYNAQDIAVFHLSAFFSPFDEVWKNPYAIGVNRESSDTSKYGMQLSTNKIMGSNLGATFVYLVDEVDDDVIGALLPDMARDGEVYSIGLEYKVQLSPSFELIPEISVRKGEYDGESSSFVKEKVKVKGIYRKKRWMLKPELYYSHSEYDEIDRIFNKERKNDSYGFNLVAIHMAPFGFRDWSVTGIAGLSSGESSIEFYDTEAFSVGVLCSYHF